MMRTVDNTNANVRVYNIHVHDDNASSTFWCTFSLISQLKKQLLSTAHILVGEAVRLRSG